MKTVKTVAVLLAIGVMVTMAVLLTPVSVSADDPVVQTRQEQAVGCGNATLRGLILNCGDEGCTEWGFDWGETEYYGSSWTHNGTCPASGATPTPSPTPTPTPGATCTAEPCAIGYFEHEVTGLDSDTVYHYRAKIKCGGVWYYGEDRLFFTGEKFETSESQNGILYRYIHGTQWGAQGFTAGNTTTYPYYIDNVYIKLNRSGEPGLVTVAIRATDTSGKPTGSDLTSGTINGDVLTTSDFGEWYCVPLTATNLAYNTTYAIVVRAPSASYPTSYVMWMRSTGYGSGVHSQTADGGLTWTAYDMDMMFQTWGVANLNMYDVKVFSSTVEEGDWLFAINYLNEVPPEYPSADPVTSYSVMLMDGSNSSDILAGSPMRCWGLKPCALYLSAASVAGLSWGGDYTLRIMRDNPPVYEPYADYALSNSDWVGSEMWWLGEWVIEVAERLEAYYGQEMTMASYGETDLEVTVLNTLGAQIFCQCMPGIGGLVPERFWGVPEGCDEIYSSEEGTHVIVDRDWVDTLGGNDSQIVHFLDTTGDLVGTSSKTAGGILCFVFFAVAVGVMVVAKGSRMSIEGALALGVLILITGGWTGIFSIAILAILGILEMIGFVWVIFWRGT